MNRILLVLFVSACSRQPLPPLPEVDKSAFLPAVRAKLAQAEGEAKSKPRDAAACGELGMLLHAHQLYLPAEACYRRARILAPAEFRWSYYLGIVQSDGGKKTDAATTLANAVRLNPDYLPARIRFAATLWDAGKPEQARAAWEAAARMDSNHAPAQLGLGRAALAASRLDEAIEHLERAVSLFPEYGAAHFALAQAYAATGDARRSEQHRKLHQEHPDRAPETPDPLLRAVAGLHAGSFDSAARGARFSAEGRFAEAAAEFEAAVRADPRDLASHQNLMIVYGNLGRIADAERHYQRALEIDAKAAEAHFNWGVLMAKTGRAKQAGAAFAKTLEAQPDHAGALTNLGVLEEENGNLAGAEKHYRSAAASHPHDAPARFRLGRLLLSLGRTEPAIGHLQQAANVPGPLQAQALYGLAVAWKMTGQPEKAASTARQALARADIRLAESIRRDFPHLGR
jgi:tetratricopeptide (TPR) repeat protein